MKSLCSFIVAAITLSLAATSARAEEPKHAGHIMVSPGEVTWGECPPMVPPGAKCATIQGDPQVPDALYAIRAKFPPNFKIPPHSHPKAEHVTVISGAIKLGLGKEFDQKAMKTMKVGSFMVLPEGLPHFAMAKGPTIIQVHGRGPLDFIYVNPADDPRKR